MAEETPVEETPLGSDVLAETYAAQAETAAQPLPTLFDTPEELAAFTRSTELPEYKIPLDTEGLVTQYPKGTPPAQIMSEAARYVTSIYKYKDDQGNVKSLHPGAYETWLNTRNPRTKRNWTDKEIVSTLANVRDLSGIEEFGDGVFTDSISGAGFFTGAVLGGKTGKVCPRFLVEA